MRPLWLFPCLALLAVSPAAFAQKKPLDHSVYDGWKRLTGTQISRDGKWTVTSITPQEGDATVQIRSVASGETIEFPRGTGFRFSYDSKYLVSTQIPPFLDSRKAKRDKVKPDDQPKNNLIIVDLATKKITTIERVAAWQLAEEDAGWLLYRPEPAKPAKPDATKTETPKPEPPKPEASKTEPPKPEPPKTEPTKKAEHKPGDAWKLRPLGTEKDTEIADVASAKWSKNGHVLVLALSTKDGKGDGVTWWDVTSNEKKKVVTGLGRYPRLAVTETGDALAFSTDKDDYAAKKPKTSIYEFEAKGEKLVKLTAPKTEDSFIVSEFGTLAFSDSGKRLLFPTGLAPVEDPETPDDEKVSLDVWTTQDPLLQPQQILQQKAERERTYSAIYFRDGGQTVQLESKAIPDVTISDKNDGAKALAAINLPYRALASWSADYNDIYVIDVASGKRTKVFEKLQGSASLSPKGRYVALYDEENNVFETIDTETLKPVAHQASIRPSLFNELNDLPDAPNAYGLAGWTKNEDRVLVYDRFDIWSVDPTGTQSPQNLTGGRPYSMRYRVIDLDRDDPTVDPNDLLLSAFRDTDKQAGVYRRTAKKFDRILLAPKSFGGFLKADKADTLLYTEEDIDQYPDLMLSNTQFQNPQRITDANPQQKDYIWPKSELVEWTGNDGQHLQGILIKPDNFDANKKYPMITYFYERNSDNLHRYTPPAPSASTVNTTLFASNGYLVFIPDIDYKVGFPGESAVSAIVPGVQSLLARGYVDEKHLGIQGQSWGGYQVAYLVTETNMFAAAEAGAPVSNMTSAYGGIRYGSGLVREFQYERQQSRIGKNLWDGLNKYIENSPLFYLEKVKTPLMIMSNDKDGAVPHTQGIELFTAMRRLQKPCWMVVYNGEDHNLVERKNRKDLSIRLSQFFDHFLKDAPLPVWMAKGLPAVDKGRTMGTELIRP